MLPSTSKVPAFIAPQLPMLSAEPPAGAGWIEEIKHDGFRTLLRMDRGQAQAFTRSGLDWSDKYQRVIEACRKLRCRSALIDGEIIVQDEKGGQTLVPYGLPLSASRIGWRCLLSTCCSWTEPMSVGCRSSRGGRSCASSFP